MTPRQGPSAILDRLDAVKRTRHGWTARCPAHAPDHRPSLGVAIGRDDRFLLYCRAGCPTDDVLRALGLGWSDLFADGRTAAPRARYAPLVESRLEVLARARRQPWNRDGVQDLYLAADALKLADRVRASITVESPDGEERLAACAELTREAEALWASALETCSTR